MKFRGCWTFVEVDRGFSKIQFLNFFFDCNNDGTQRESGLGGYTKIGEGFHVILTEEEIDCCFDGGGNR